MLAPTDREFGSVKSRGLHLSLDFPRLPPDWATPQRQPTTKRCHFRERGGEARSNSSWMWELRCLLEAWFAEALPRNSHSGKRNAFTSRLIVFREPLVVFENKEK